MKKKIYLLFGVIIFATVMLNVSLFNVNNKSLNSISILRKALATEGEGEVRGYSIDCPHTCIVYDPRTGLYGNGWEVDCCNTTEHVYCSEMYCCIVGGM